MALDEVLTRRCAGGGPATLRFYGWERPTLSIGKNQPLARSADLEACRRLGIALVRRPSGGRAVLHENEVTYALSLPSSDPLLAGGARRALAALAEALASGLRRLGVPAERVVSGSEAPRGAPEANPPCFLFSSREEVVARGMKVAGAAQWRLPGALLQHGSIPLRLDAERLLQATGASRGAGRVSPLHAPAGGLEAWLAAEGGDDGPGAPDLHGMAGAVIEALREGLEEGLRVRLEPAELSREEVGEAFRLAKRRYAAAAWTARW